MEFAVVNVDTYRIELLGRWGSDVVMRYAKLAPLTNLTEHVRDLQTTATLSDVIAELRTSLGVLSERFSEMKTYVLDELRGEVKVADATAAETKAGEDFVVNSKTGVHHRVQLRVGEPVFWSARCSWAFGCTRHTFTSQLPSSPLLLCDKCFHKERKKMLELWA